MPLFHHLPGSHFRQNWIFKEYLIDISYKPDERALLE